MSATKLLTIMLAGLLVLGGATAVTALGPATGADVPDEANETVTNQTEDMPENATDHPIGADGSADNASEMADNATESVGPPGGLPEAVPDVVRDIHSAINDFLSGTVDHLGEALRSITSSL